MFIGFRESASSGDCAERRKPERSLGGEEWAHRCADGYLTLNEYAVRLAVF
jgi:hypothetical protein